MGCTQSNGNPKGDVTGPRGSLASSAVGVGGGGGGGGGSSGGVGDLHGGEETTGQSDGDGRIEGIEETRTISFGGVTLRYAFLSQRGYYPDDQNKPNQDAYSVTHNFSGQETDAFFAVYDGHGRDGDKCAKFARESLPELVAQYIDRAKSVEGKVRRASGIEDSPDGVLELTKDQTQAACRKAHIECNRDMHRSPNVDDSLSGTTSISAYIHGRRNRITVCNVGDSRAIIGQRLRQGEVESASPSTLRAIPLSRDQTPYRRDERIRIKATGARILSLDQIEGLEPINDDDDDFNGSGNWGDDLELGEEIDEGGDPPRVWSPHGEYPGTAFTRSLGDSIAEELGVFAEPEMLTKELTPDDKIIVLASDGVFEFLTNQSVIDICAKFHDPLEACRAVVAESYELWLQYELRTDDITIICMFVDGVDMRASRKFSALSSRLLEAAAELEENGAPPPDPETYAKSQRNGKKNGNDEVDEPISVEGVRPVRSHVSKEKTKAIEQMRSKMPSESDLASDTAMEDFDLASLYTEKTDDEKTRIAEAIRASVMFQNITDAQRELIFGVMEPIAVREGDWIIRQGTVGDRFYIVDHGRFEVRIVPDGQEDRDGSGGNVVHVYVGSRDSHAHPSFGELALMYSAPRAASIIAQTDGQLWALHRYAFRKVLAEQTERKDLMKVLRRVETLKTLDQEEIENLAASMEEATYGRHDIIIRQGDLGDTFFVICPGGTCERIQQVSEDGRTVDSVLKANDYFGEEVIAAGERRYAATIIAASTTTVWRVDKTTIKRTIGKLRMKRGNSNVA